MIKYLILAVTISVAAQASDEKNEDSISVRAGSLSRWSLQWILNYSGPSIDTPFSSWAPNPNNDPVTPRVQLAGSLSGRYRENKFISYGLGAGLQVDTPFHNPQNFSLSNPSVDVSISSDNQRWLSIFSWMYYTDPVYKNLYYQSNFAISISTRQQLLENWYWGLQWGGSLNSLTRSQNYQVTATLGIYPSVDYQLNSRTSLRTSLGFSNYQLGAENQWVNNKLSQTLGVSFVTSRNLYLYGYALFYPLSNNDMNMKASSLGISVTYNLF